MTLPIKTLGQVNGEDVNLVDLNQIRTMVRGLIVGTPPPPTTLPAETVSVVNANGQAGLAADLETALTGKGAVKGTATKWSADVVAEHGVLRDWWGGRGQRGGHDAGYR